MMRSVSEPSFNSGDNRSTTQDGVSHGVGRTVKGGVVKAEHYRGQKVLEGRLRKYTLALLMLPWKMTWQCFVNLTIIYKYCVHFLLGYYLEDNPKAYLEYQNHLCEAVFICDVIIHVLHAYWGAVRLHMRVYRRTQLLLIWDILTIVPVSIIFKIAYGNNRKFLGYRLGRLLGRWMGISRIYRLYFFFTEFNSTMRKSRILVYLAEHITVLLLLLHACTCVWYTLLIKNRGAQPWYNLGYPPHVNSERLKFDTYIQCWYYCTCRLFNIIFGDAFPLSSVTKILTSVITLGGCCVVRYRFIGYLAWELTVQNYRWILFVDRFHHLLKYLRSCGAPEWLVEQARNYKLSLWEMKDGILHSTHLQKLPYPLQMELIFDINVGHFHNSLLFRDTGEAFMRQISLIMHHEIFLEGQQVWSQGVVKCGMLCVRRGVIEMLSDEDDESPMIAFTEGTVLGELSLFYSIPSKVTVKAATYVELQVLKRTDFMRAMTENPYALHGIRTKINTRLRTSKRRQEAIEAYDKGDSRLIRTRYRPMKVLKDNLTGVEEEDPTFVDDSHMYYRDENNERKPKFTPEYLQLYHMCPNVTTVEAPRICLKSSFPWILEPNTGFTQMFDFIHFMLVLYVCITGPITAMDLHQSDVTRVMKLIVMAGLVCNIYLQVTTCIINKDIRLDTVRDIAEYKLATIGFYLDVISVFPVYIFSSTLDPDGATAWNEIVKLVPCLQVWHLWDYMNKWERNVNSNPKFLTLLKYLLLLLILCYWSGCFLYIYSCPKRLCKEESWMFLLIFWETKVFQTNYARHERPILTSWSFGTSVFTGSGITEIRPGNVDLVIICFLIFAGFYLNCFYIAKICSLYLLHTQRRVKFMQTMRELFYFLSVNRVSSKIKGRVRKFFCVQWYYNNAVSADEVFYDVSSNIQQEVLSTEMVETLLFCPLFQGSSRDFLQTVAANTRTVILPDDEIVQHAADISRDMYILQKGHCNILNQLGKVIKTSGPGSHFGVVEMLFGLPKVYTVLTSTNCVLRHVEYTSLVQCWSTFPDISHPINLVLQNEEVLEMAKLFEDAKPLTGRMDIKMSRLAQELKESFVVLSSREQRKHFVQEFERLGIMRFIRYVFLPGCVTPHGIFLKFWCCLRLISAMYFVFIIPYNLAVKQHLHDAVSYNWADMFLYVDLIVMSYLSYYNEKQLLVTHPLLTVSKYLRTTFILDIISVFPFERLFQLVNDGINRDMYRINRLLLVARITGTFNYWEGDIMQVNQLAVLLKFLPVCVALVNLSTAFVFMNTCQPIINRNSSYIYVNCSDAVKLNSYSVEWAAREYINTVVWTFEIFLGCGCTPMRISNSVDVMLVMWLQLAGYLYFAFMFGYVSATRPSATHALLEHTENMRDLENFLYQENVDPALTAKTLKYFEYVWKKTNGSDPQKICRSLNSALMEDTLVHMYEHALREVPLFGKVERSFIRVITKHLNEMYFLKSETVVQCKDMQKNIYIIYRGKVDVLSTYNEMVTCMGPGGMFGNFTGLPISCSEVSIVASRSLDLLVIPSSTFFNLVKYYPKLKEPLRKAFEMSKDYILPITMDTYLEDSSSCDDSAIGSDSLGDSDRDSRSGGGSNIFDNKGASQISRVSSQSNVSQAKSLASVGTFQSYSHISNIVRPGTFLYQGFGYAACVVSTFNYMLLMYEIVTLNDCKWIFWLQSLLDIFFYVKVFLTMHQGYVNKRGDFVSDVTRCRHRYFSARTRMWTDFLVIVPFELLGFCFPNPLKAMHYLRINKIFRLKYLIEFYRSTAAELTNNLTTLQSVTTLLVVLILIHTFTCSWLLLLIALDPRCRIQPTKMFHIDQVAPIIMWDYVTSVYVVISELTATGGDEFTIVETLPLVILTLSAVCGKMLATMMVATAIQVAYTQKATLTKYERKTRELIDMLMNQGLSKYQTDKYWKYVQQLWVSERGRQLPVLLAQTPYVRRCDLMSAMFGHHLRNCYIFADTGEPFLRQLTVALEYTIFFPGNYIVVAGDSEARMYWVASGTVGVVSVRSDLTETTHEFLTTGDVFGILQGLNRGITHCFSYRAETKVSILTLSLDSWVNILPFFPEAMNIINDKSDALFAQM